MGVHDEITAAMDGDTASDWRRARRLLDEWEAEGVHPNDREGFDLLRSMSDRLLSGEGFTGPKTGPRVEEFARLAGTTLGGTTGTESICWMHDTEHMELDEPYDDGRHGLCIRCAARLKALADARSAFRVGETMVLVGEPHMLRRLFEEYEDDADLYDGDDGDDEDGG